MNFLAKSRLSFFSSNKTDLFEYVSRVLFGKNAANILFNIAHKRRLLKKLFNHDAPGVHKQYKPNIKRIGGSRLADR